MSLYIAHVELKTLLVRVKQPIQGCHEWFYALWPIHNVSAYQDIEAVVRQSCDHLVRGIFDLGLHVVWVAPIEETAVHLAVSRTRVALVDVLVKQVHH